MTAGHSSRSGTARKAGGKRVESEAPQCHSVLSDCRGLFCDQTVNKFKTNQNRLIESNKNHPFPSERESGVADGARTRDSQNHNLELYQLSYGHREKPGAFCPAHLERQDESNA